MDWEHFWLTFWPVFVASLPALLAAVAAFIQSLINSFRASAVAAKADVAASEARRAAVTTEALGQTQGAVIAKIEKAVNGGTSNDDLMKKLEEMHRELRQ